MQKFLLPISIIIAGLLISGAVFYTNQNTSTTPINNGNTVAEKIRGVQQDDHIQGSPEAKIVIVEYSDTECPYCQLHHTTLQQIIDEYGESGDVAWVYRHFPIPQLHPKAAKEGEALECAAAQGGNNMFWKYTEELYNLTNSNNSLDIGVYNSPAKVPTDANGNPYYAQATPRSDTDAGKLSDIAESLELDVSAFEICLASGTYKDRVASDEAEAQAAGGRGTPHNVLLIGKEQIPLEGYKDFASMKNIIDSILAN